MNFKLKIYAGIVIGLMTVLCLKLAVVQLFYSDMYKTQAKENRIRLVSIKAPRGEIYDRNGDILAANKLVYILSLTNPGESERDQLVQRLVSVLQPYYPEANAAFINEKIDLGKSRLFEPVVLIRDIPWELVVKLEENRQNLPGAAITIEPLRDYPQGTLAGHVLGYIHSINQDELAADSANYSVNSLIGKSGIEKQYEAELRGVDGARRLEVDAQGRPVGEQATLNPVPGNNLKLTIDDKLQTVMEYSMASNLARLQKSYPKAKVGAAVLIDVKTGEILAMDSSPAMRPDDWKGNISSQLASYYFPQGSTYNPLEPGAALNRAIQATYPPGSTFKPITGMAALEAGVMKPLTDYVNCPGRYWIAPFIPCTGVHGNVNYYSGMAASCNVYFQEMGRRATKDNIIKVAQDFGLGDKTSIDLPYETQGLVPTPAWKKEINEILINRKYDNLRQQLENKYSQLIAAATSADAVQDLEKKKKNEKAQLEAQYNIDYNWDTNWQAYDTFNMSIGQGANQYTIIELADYVAALANGGDLLRPHILKEILSPDKVVTQEIKPEIVRHVSESAQTLAETRRAMIGVTKPGGTASFLFTNFPESINVAAKTGTAETNRVGDNAQSEFHGTFIAFAPADNPQVAFAGVIEYGQHGSDSVGWVCKDVFEQYFGLIDHYAAIKAQTSSSVDQSALPILPTAD
ncbi:MAG: penicillin-binding transpeptidase domain-containing protein [Syntrophomonadaceae bacterium]|nr:penicillin-binding transpeptidase domain-containing protein [Syntrophomonadaceae bacterium]